ncbi:MAG: hypothetical protein AAB466_14910 [Verrucomicrobiota bacterium]
MPAPASTEFQVSSPQVLPFIHPLDDFYAQARLPLPLIERVPGQDVPQPYRRLLVHEEDMTPTLEAFYGQSVHLHVLRRQQRGDYYFREVVLVLEDDATPVEFGAIKINLSLLSPSVRRGILEEHLPLGHILADCSVTHHCHPKAYLRVQTDSFIQGALRLSSTRWLYGRRNTLVNAQESSLAEVVEILPPTPQTD